MAKRRYVARDEKQKKFLADYWSAKAKKISERVQRARRWWRRWLRRRRQTIADHRASCVAGRRAEASNSARARASDSHSDERRRRDEQIERAAPSRVFFLPQISVCAHQLLLVLKNNFFGLRVLQRLFTGSSTRPVADVVVPIAVRSCGYLKV